MRVALNGILQRGGEGKRIQQVYRDSSSSVSESMYQVSSASTLRDTEEIREVTANYFAVNVVSKLIGVM